MPTARASTLVDWSSSKWSSNECCVLVIGEPDLEVAPASQTLIETPKSLAELQSALDSMREPFDSALINSWGREIRLPDLADVLRRSVRPGGIVAFVVPITQLGWRGARGAVLGLIRRQRPVPLQELCNALLLGRLVDVRARPLEGATGHSVVWATVPPTWREDIESSAVLTKDPH